MNTFWGKKYLKLLPKNHKGERKERDMKLSIIIPAYNESESVYNTTSMLRPVIEKLQDEYDVQLIFVNDGSKDNTEELLRDAFSDVDYAHIISYKNNRGLGGAIRTGFKHADADLILTTDFDGTYDFNTIPEILEYFKDESVDMVTASPYHPLGGVEGVPQYRLLFSHGASLLYRILVNPRIHCWTALFRAYRRPVITHTNFEDNGFLFGTQLMVNAIRNGFKVKEYPTILNSRAFGQSSIRIAQVTMSHLKYQSSLLSTGNGLQFLTVMASAFALVIVGGFMSIRRAIKV